MINELKVYQQGNTSALDQIQGTIESLMRKFTMNIYHQEFDITLSKDELPYVSHSFRRYLENVHGKDQETYTIKGDKSILNILKFSTSPKIRQKYFSALSESSKQNIPILLQILYYRLQKAKMLGYENSIDLIKGERAFKIDNPTEAIQRARQVLRGKLNEDISLIKHLVAEPSFNIATSIFEKDYVK